MGKLADRIKNLAKKAKSSKDELGGIVVLTEDDLDNESMDGIEVEDDELDAIEVESEEDLDNDFRQIEERQRGENNKLIGEKRKKPSPEDKHWDSVKHKYGPGLHNTREDRVRNINPRGINLRGPGAAASLNEQSDKGGEGNKAKMLARLLEEKRKEKNRGKR